MIDKVRRAHEKTPAARRENLSRHTAFRDAPRGGIARRTAATPARRRCARTARALRERVHPPRRCVRAPRPARGSPPVPDSHHPPCPDEDPRFRRSRVKNRSRLRKFTDACKTDGMPSSGTPQPQYRLEGMNHRRVQAEGEEILPEGASASSVTAERRRDPQERLGRGLPHFRFGSRARAPSWFILSVFRCRRTGAALRGVRRVHAFGGWPHREADGDRAHEQEPAAAGAEQRAAARHREFTELLQYTS